MARGSADPRQCAAHEPLYDVHPRTGATIEVFFAHHTLETLGRCGGGWFWCCRRRGFAPVGTDDWSVRDELCGVSERDEAAVPISS